MPTDDLTYSPNRSGRGKQIFPAITDTTVWTKCEQVVTSKLLDEHVRQCARCRRLEGRP
jgi:hypothetical protein